MTFRSFLPFIFFVNFFFTFFEGGLASFWGFQNFHICFVALFAYIVCFFYAVVFFLRIMKVYLELSSKVYASPY